MGRRDNSKGSPSRGKGGKGGGKRGGKPQGGKGKLWALVAPAGPEASWVSLASVGGNVLAQLDGFNSRLVKADAAPVQPRKTRVCSRIAYGHWV